MIVFECSNCGSTKVNPNCDGELQCSDCGKMLKLYQIKFAILEDVKDDKCCSEHTSCVKSIIVGETASPLSAIV